MVLEDSSYTVFVHIR